MPVPAQRILVILGLLALLLLATSDVLRSEELQTSENESYAQVRRGQASIPIGHADFCMRYGRECGLNRQAVPFVEITDARWYELTKVNARFNTTIQQVTDEANYQVEELWDYPVSRGDCEDFALAKRRALIEAGWNPSVLLMTVVKRPDGEGHAVLMVRTDRGDLILDNLDSFVRVWKDTPYAYLKRQSQTHAGQWVDILDTREVFVASR